MARKKKSLARRFDPTKIFAYAIILLFAGLLGYNAVLPTISLEIDKILDQMEQTLSGVISKPLQSEDSKIVKEPESAPISYPYGSFKVTEVIDGDTIKVLLNGTETRIRLIGIDAPEYTSTKECYGDEATSRLEKLILNKFVGLETDSTQGDKDRYDRLLRYVWTMDNKNIAKLLISEGLAKEYTYDKVYKYQDEFINAEETAQRNNLGLWRYCSAN